MHHHFSHYYSYLQPLFDIFCRYSYAENYFHFHLKYRSISPALFYLLQQKHHILTYNLPSYITSAKAIDIGNEIFSITTNSTAIEVNYAQPTSTHIHMNLSLGGNRFHMVHATPNECLRMGHTQFKQQMNWIAKWISEFLSSQSNCL